MCLFICSCSYKDNREDYNKMSSASHTLGIDDSATRIYEEIKKIIR